MLSCFSCVRLSVTLWTIALQDPLSMGFSRQEYWSGLPCPPPGDLPHPGIEPMSPEAPALQTDSLPLRHWGKPIYRLYIHTHTQTHTHIFISYLVSQIMLCNQ